MAKFAGSAAPLKNKNGRGVVRAYPQVTPSGVWNDILND